MNLSYSEILTVVGMVMGGAWALMERFQKKSAELEEARNSNTNRAISDLEAITDKHSEMIRSLERDMQTKFLAFTESMMKISVQMNNYAETMQQLRNESREEFLGFHKMIAALGEENITKLPGDRLRIGDRKPTK